MQRENWGGPPRGIQRHSARAARAELHNERSHAKEHLHEPIKEFTFTSRRHGDSTLKNHHVGLAAFEKIAIFRQNESRRLDRPAFRKGGPNGPPFCFSESRAPVTDIAKIEEIIAPSLDAMGYRIVRILIIGGRRATLQVMAERLDDAAMSVEDCAEISRTVSALLDVNDPIAGAYDLEVSSPGLDRPLVRREDYARFAGFEAKIELTRPRDGRRRFRGKLLGLDGDDIRLLVDAVPVALPLAEVARAKLVITDELLANNPTQPRH
jgi:ribosome maturation factor RimP